MENYYIPAVPAEHGDRKFSDKREYSIDMTKAVELYVNCILTYVHLDIKS